MYFFSEKLTQIQAALLFEKFYMKATGSGQKMGPRQKSHTWLIIGY